MPPCPTSPSSKPSPPTPSLPPACVEAEKIYASAPALCAVGCRKALELVVRWVYAADNTMRMPYKDNLQSLIHEESFREAVDGQT